MPAKVEYPMKHTLIEVEGAVDFEEVSLYMGPPKGRREGLGPKPKHFAKLLRMVANAREMYAFIEAIEGGLRGDDGPHARRLLGVIDGEPSLIAEKP